MTKRVCVIPGDDAAPEAVWPTIDILRSLRAEIEFIMPPTGEGAIKRFGTGFPPDAKEAIDKADCTLFGATSGKSSEALHYLRWGKKTYANIRPVKWVTNMRSPLRRPEGIDLVIVRENLEGLYPNREGDLAELAALNLGERDGRKRTGEPLNTTAKGKYALRIISEENTTKIAKKACEVARQRKNKGGKGKLTCATKSNVLSGTCGLFQTIVTETVKGYPELTYEHMYIDNFAHQLVIYPQQFDVVVMANEHGDILSDAAAGIIGGLGLAPSACLGDDYAYFEPIHGSAPDIAGKNIINPTATLLSAKMMLEYLGFEGQALRLERAIYQVYREGKYLTPDQGGKVSTHEFFQAVELGLS